MIRWYIDKLHVSTPDDQIIDDIGKRAISAGWGPLSIIGAIQHALNVHHENQRFYAEVMNGSI